MEIFIPWWAFALAPLGLGFFVAWLIPYGGYYDFVSPLLAAAAVLVGFALSVGVFIGHFT